MQNHTNKFLQNKTDRSPRLISVLPEDRKFSNACSRQFWMECPWKFPGLLHTASPISVPESIRSFSLPALISNKYQALAMNKPQRGKSQESWFICWRAVDGKGLLVVVFNISRAETKVQLPCPQEGTDWEGTISIFCPAILAGVSISLWTRHPEDQGWLGRFIACCHLVS